MLTPSTPGPIPDLTVATTGEQPCSDARRAALDEAIANGGVWMPNADLARMDDLVRRLALQSEAAGPAVGGRHHPLPPGGAEGLSRARTSRTRSTASGAARSPPHSGGPALVLDADGDQPAEVDVIMGDTHIVLVGQDATTGDELLAVARSMTPLH